jgi:hypothetical protein
MVKTIFLLYGAVEAPLYNFWAESIQQQPDYRSSLFSASTLVRGPLSLFFEACGGCCDKDEAVPG